MCAFTNVFAQSTQEVKYGYDALNRIVTVTYGDKTIKYEYDKLGNRKKKEVTIAVSIDEPQTNDAGSDILKLYPNPTSGLLKVEMLKETTIKQMYICDMSGKTVVTIDKSQFTDKQITINLSHLATGNYILNLQTEKQIINRKIIITNE